MDTTENVDIREPKKLFKYTITFTTEVPNDSCYRGTEAWEAEALGIQLPIDTAEKKRLMEDYFLKEGIVDVGTLVEDVADSVKIVIEVVDDPTDPDYLKQA